MDKELLRKIALDAAVDRVVGSSSIPVRHFADLVKRFGSFVEDYKKERSEAKAQYEQEKEFLREIQKNLNEYAVELVRIRQIKGEKGDRGEDGKDGRDGRDAKEVDIDALVARVMRNIRIPKDGKDAKVDLDKLAKRLAKEINLDEYRKRLDNEVASYRSQLAGKHYGQNTWARGGGDTVAAGENVILTKDANGNVVINALGGGSGTNVATQYSLTATQDGDDVIVDLSQLTNFATLQNVIAAYRNQIPQTDGITMQVSPTEVRFLNAAADEVYSITYSYT